MADGARHRLLGRGALPTRLGNAAARADRHRHSPKPAARHRGGNRPAADADWLAQRRTDRARPGDDGTARHARLPRAAAARRADRRRGLDAAPKSARLPLLDPRGDGCRVGTRAGEGAGPDRQPSRLLVGRARARYPGRAAAQPAPRHRRHSVHGSVRLALDVHRRRHRR